MKKIKVEAIESTMDSNVFIYIITYPTGEIIHYKTTVEGWAILSSVFTEAGYSIEYI